MRKSWKGILKMFRFENLEIWQKAIVLSREIFGIADTFPQKVQYSLSSQLRSAVLSIPNNIAEGSGSSSIQEFKSFLNYSIRSAYEVVSMLILSRDSGYMKKEDFDRYFRELEILVKQIRTFKKKI